jgi:IPT/TIG domain
VIDPFGAAIPDCHAGAPGWTVGIKGRNVWDARVVTFGGVPAPRVWVDALDEIHVTVPEDVFGIVTISLVTRAGPSQSTFEQSWFLVAQPVLVPVGPPVVFGLLPSSGPAGTAVTIVGADLLPPTSIRFGRVFADLSTLPPLEFRNPTSVTVAAPPGPSGPVPVVVTSDKGSSQPWLLSTFVYT